MIEWRFALNRRLKGSNRPNHLVFRGDPLERRTGTAVAGRVHSCRPPLVRTAMPHSGNPDWLTSGLNASERTFLSVQESILPDVLEVEADQILLRLSGAVVDHYSSSYFSPVDATPDGSF